MKMVGGSPHSWQYTFQNPATPVMDGIINLYNFIFIYLIIVFVVVIWFLVRSLYLFRASQSVEPTDFSHDPYIEITWTVAPAFILIAISLPSFALLYSMDDIGDPYMTVKVTGHQWYWSYELDSVRADSLYDHILLSLKKLPKLPKFLRWQNSPLLVKIQDEYDRTARIQFEEMRKWESRWHDYSSDWATKKIQMDKQMRRTYWLSSVEQSNYEFDFRVFFRPKLSNLTDLLFDARKKIMADKKLGYISRDPPFNSKAVYEKQIRDGWTVGQAQDIVRSRRHFARRMLDDTVRDFLRSHPRYTYEPGFRRPFFYYYAFITGPYVATGSVHILGPHIKFDSYMIPESDLSKRGLRLLEVDNKLVLPIARHIRVLVTSTDVIHSWAVPSLGVKIDAIPGRLNQTTIFLKREGVFYGQCSELCGVNHGFMPIVVKGVTPSAFTKWIGYKTNLLSAHDYIKGVGVRIVGQE